ncbi:MAG: chromate transporter [Bacteroidales bacterium]|nr:chromate transporter [Bacteroidales bacterium]
MTTHAALFRAFFKIGMFTLGGGYAMIPLMEREVVDRAHWLGRQEFLDAMAVAQSMPGIFAVNMATHVGYQQRGVGGALAAVLGNIAAPIGIMVLLAMFFRSFAGNHLVDSVFKGIRPAVVALIASPVVGMARTARVRWSNAVVPVGAALLVWLLGVSPIVVVLLAAAGGLVHGLLSHRKTSER